MPTLKKIVIRDFRNIALQELFFSPNVNCISGNNGEGKTNLLDAIHYLSMTRSAFPSQDRYIARHGTDSFSVGGSFIMENGLESRFSIQAGAGEKKLVRDDKPYGRFSEHIGVLPVVMVSPGDISLVSESGEERRRMANALLSQMDREYLSAAQSYNRLLALRNKELKSPAPDAGLLSVLDERMAVPAAFIYESRAEMVRRLNPSVESYYRMISGGSESVSIEYRSDLEKASLPEILSDCRERDYALKYTSAGVQRDDFVFLMDGQPIRRFGSQGQQKSFLVALKFAQYEIMKQAYGFAPTLLLDDVFDKLDLGRISNLVSMVAGSDFGQIFITDCDRTRLQGVVDRITEDRAYFEAKGGVFTRL